MPTLPPGLSPGTIPYTGGGTDTAAVRLAGYAVAMRAAGLEPHTIEGGFRSEAAHEAVRRLLDQSALSAALLVSNNLMMLGALKAVREAGLRMPDDLAIVGIGRSRMGGARRSAADHDGCARPWHAARRHGATAPAGLARPRQSSPDHPSHGAQSPGISYALPSPNPAFNTGLAAGRSRCQGLVRRSAAGPG